MSDVFKEKRPLKIEFHYGSGMPASRVIADLFETETGICFFDVGWYDSDGHPVHFIDGKLTGDGPWVLKGEDQDYTISVMDDDDPAFEEWEDWKQFFVDEKIPEGLAREIFERNVKMRKEV